MSTKKKFPVLGYFAFGFVLVVAVIWGVFRDVPEVGTWSARIFTVGIGLGFIYYLIQFFRSKRG